MTLLPFSMHRRRSAVIDLRTLHRAAAGPRDVFTRSGLRQRRFAYLMLFVVAGWCCCTAPAQLYGAATFWAWSAIAAAASAGAALCRTGPNARPAPLRALLCPLALCAALCVDFANTPPEGLLSLCGGRYDANFWSAHLRLLPTASLTMCVLALRRVRLSQSFDEAALLRWSIGSAANLAVMMLAMKAAASLCRLSTYLHWPWTVDGVVCTMLVGMALYHALRAVPRLVSSCLVDRSVVLLP